MLKYPGAKRRMASWILSQMPPHNSYWEPFFGSGAVLFQKPLSPIETVNDLDGDVVNLFRMVRDEPEKLAAAVAATPYARQEYEAAFAPTDDPVEKARRFLVRCQQGFGSRAGAYKPGWKNDVRGRERAYDVLSWNRAPGWIAEAAGRLKRVQIEHMPAVELIGRFNYADVLIYADPPYLPATRTGKQYRHEMAERDHVELLEALKRHRGLVMLSGYPNPLYDELLKGWSAAEFGNRVANGGARTEVLWMNFETQTSLWETGT